MIKAMTSHQNILHFWFGDDKNTPLQNAEMWWKQDNDLDAQIKETFEESLKEALEAKLESWRKTPHGCLAYIILLDQFSRNMYRNTPQAFKQDVLALAASLSGQRNNFDRELSIVERWFFYMPMMHSEDLDMQRRCVEVYEQLLEETPEKLKKTVEGALDYAVRHMKVIERFGRFPHRNKILGRKSSDEEEAFLKSDEAPF